MLSLLLVSRRRGIDSVSLFLFPFPFMILAIEGHCEQSVDRMRHDCDAKQRAEGFVPSTKLTIVDLRLEIVAEECLDSLPCRLQLT